jgi:hypothetical protein
VTADEFADSEVAMARESRELRRLLNAMQGASGTGEYWSIRCAAMAAMDRLDAARRHVAADESAVLDEWARHLVAEPRIDARRFTKRGANRPDDGIALCQPTATLVAMSSAIGISGPS